MSEHEWKPGDVVYHPDGLYGMVVRRGCGCAKHAMRGDLHVHYEDGDWDAGAPCDLHPLVVIDPEDREQVERLVLAYMNQKSVDLDNKQPMTVRELRMRAALREFADPKPTEPGVGGMVETRDGKEWVHVNVPQAPWMYRSQWAVYSDLDVARVIAQGVES